MNYSEEYRYSHNDKLGGLWMIHRNKGRKSKVYWALHVNAYGASIGKQYCKYIDIPKNWFIFGKRDYDKSNGCS